MPVEPVVDGLSLAWRCSSCARMAIYGSLAAKPSQSLSCDGDDLKDAGPLSASLAVALSLE
jgi:hypothetical protein